MDYESFNSRAPALIKPCAIMYAGRTKRLSEDESILRHMEITRQLQIMHPKWAVSCTEDQAHTILRNEKEGIEQNAIDLGAENIKEDIKQRTRPWYAKYIDKEQPVEHDELEPRKLSAATGLKAILAASRRKLSVDITPLT